MIFNMKKLLLLSLLLLISNHGFANQCPDGSRPIKSISDDGSYFEYKCAGKTNTSKQSNNAVSPYPLAIQPDSLDVFCDKVNADCSDDESQKWYRAYYTLPANKAMAIAYPEGRILGGISGAFFWYGETSPSRAKAQALSRCNITKAVNSDKCYILLDGHLIVNKDYIKILNKKTSTQSSYSSNSNSSNKIPANAFKSGNTWYCKSGYFKFFTGAKDICRKVPKNATKNADDRTWNCDAGYVRSGNNCLKPASSSKKIPENAYSTGSYSSGDGWDCKGGYVKKGNKCVAKSNTQETKVIQNESSNYLEEIKQAKELLDSGVITQDEFTAIKKKIIDDI